MSCTRTVWLIDTENIPKKWVKTVYFKTKRDKLIIFLGPEATCMSLKELQVFLTKYPANQVEFCNSNAGKNSMDSELNAILNAGKDLHGSTIYVTLFPCNECAKAIIQSGIKRIVYLDDKYKDSNNNIAARFLLKTAGVGMKKYNKSNRTISVTL